MSLKDLSNMPEFKQLKDEMAELKKEYQELKEGDAPVVYTQSPDRTLETILEKGSEIVKVFIEHQSEVDKVKADTERFAVEQAYIFKEKELATKNAIVRRQMTQQMVIIFSGIMATGILAVTGNLTEGFLTIIAVIIGAAIKDNVIDFVKDITQPTKKDGGE